MASIKINPEDLEHQHFAYAMQLATLSALSMALQAAFELGVFEILAKAGHGAELSPVEIAAEITATNSDAASMVDRILRLLASHSVVGCSAATDQHGNLQRLYSLTPVSKFYVRNEDGVSLGPMISLIQDKVFLDSWSEVKSAIIEGGIPFNRAHGGVHAFEYPGMDPRFNQVFNTAMLNHTTMVVKKIVESYKGFANINQLVDVGGGLGVTLQIITSTYPSIKGINFDLPHVIHHAPSYPGVEHVGGDMFESIPKGDAIFMKWILHDWSDEQCVKLLNNCRIAIPDNGKVIVMESVFTKVPETTVSMKGIGQLDIIMMTQNPGGKERTEDEFKALATKAGFNHITFNCLMQWILHDWSDECCVKLLKNCHVAIPNNGKVIVVEFVLPTIPNATAAMKCTTQIDVHMLAQNPGGRERTRDEFKALATRAGFKKVTFHCSVCNFLLMEFSK